MLDLLFQIAGSLLFGSACALLVGCIIDALTVEKTVREKVSSEDQFKNAFKAMIKSKDTRTVHVGIYGSNNTHLGDIEIESEKGVSSDVRVGHTFYV